MPAALDLPAPLWIVTVLHVLTLTLHFAAMNLLVGGLVVILIGRFEDRWSSPTVQRLRGLFPVLMAATITLGVAPLLFSQLTHGRLIYAASIVSAWWWLSVPLVVMLAYGALYGGASGRRPALLVAAHAGLIYVAVIYGAVFSLAERPELQETLYASSQAGLSLAPNAAEWLPRVLHMLAGAVTLGAFLVGVLARGDSEATRVSRRFFLGGMIAAAITGLAYLLHLGDALRPFMRSPGIWSLTVGIVLSAVSLPFWFKRRFAVAGGLLFASLLAMVVARDALRLVRIPESYRPATAYADRIAPQWGPFALFLVCLAGAVAVIVWMLRMVRSCPEES